MIPAKLPKTQHYRNDKWETGYHFGPMADQEGNPPGGPCLSCRMQFREKTTGKLGYEFSSIPSASKGLITIVNALHYEFDIQPDQSLPLIAGIWEWDLETFENPLYTGLPLTLISGTVEVKKDISHD